VKPCRRGFLTNPITGNSYASLVPTARAGLPAPARAPHRRPRRHRVAVVDVLQQPGKRAWPVASRPCFASRRAAGSHGTTTQIRRSSPAVQPPSPWPFPTGSTPWEPAHPRAAQLQSAVARSYRATDGFIRSWERTIPAQR